MSDNRAPPKPISRTKTSLKPWKRETKTKNSKARKAKTSTKIPLNKLTPTKISKTPLAYMIWVGSILILSATATIDCGNQALIQYWGLINLSIPNQRKTIARDMRIIKFEILRFWYIHSVIIIPRSHSLVQGTGAPFH